MQNQLTVEERVIVAIRRITRSVDIHSDFLKRNFGLTGPQLTILRVVKRLQPVPAGEVARTANFNQGTLTGIFDRLESNGLVSRTRHAPDRRTVMLRLTAEGDRVLAAVPFLLRKRCLESLETMPASEQALLLKMLEHLAHLMEDDSPIA
ncbi:MAG TPA: MarR family winged helix-turn-helix transcriptional regulator [Planctomycetaceae bacterium]|jgi:DNA-binding MarR family transcriptional regulator